ncbi:MAG: hypothetical protein SH820_09730 [Xanthomonadales bacterium]|nr:hypothetical protein [Xanthomonadales bacterium]
MLLEVSPLLADDNAGTVEFAPESSQEDDVAESGHLSTMTAARGIQEWLVMTGHLQPAPDRRKRER